MRVYSAHIRRGGLDPDRDIVLLKEGFCWPAALFAPAWGLWHGLWMTAIIWGAVVIAPVIAVTAFHLDHGFVGWLVFGAGLIAGFVGNDLRRAALTRNGFAFEDVVAGEDRFVAEYRFFERHPALAADIADLTGVRAA